MHIFHCSALINLLEFIHCTLYIVKCTLYSLHCKVLIVQCLLYSINCTLYICHCSADIHRWDTAHKSVHTWQDTKREICHKRMDKLKWKHKKLHNQQRKLGIEQESKLPKDETYNIGSLLIYIICSSKALYEIQVIYHI